MTRISPRCVRQGLLALALAGLILPDATPTLSADERPDLQIKVTGLTGGSQRNVKITVDNISNWWSAKTYATIQTVPPTDNDPMFVEIPDLGEKGTKDKSTPNHVELIYPLREDCDGHTVRASLTAGANYEGVTESTTAMANNVHEMLICKPKTAPAVNPQSKSGDILVKDVGTTSKSDTALVLGDKRNLTPWALPGPHSETLTEPTAFKTHEIAKVDEGPFTSCDANVAGVIGQGNIGHRYRDFVGCNVNRVAQVVVSFDLDWLAGIQKKQITRAELAVDEDVEFGDPHTTCIGGVGMLPENWEVVIKNKALIGGAADGLRFQDGPGATRSWNVLKDISEATNPGRSMTGFVLHSSSEDLDTEFTSGCSATLSNPRLVLEYSVLQ